MAKNAESRTYRVANNTFDQSQWANWERRMIGWDFEVVRIDAGGTPDGIYVARNDFRRAIPELGKSPACRAASAAWNSIGKVVARAEWDKDQTVVRPNDVVRWDDIRKKSHSAYSAGLIDRLSGGEDGAMLMSATGAGVAVVEFLAGIVEIANKNPAFFADSSQRAAEIILALSTEAPNPVV